MRSSFQARFARAPGRGHALGEARGAVAALVLLAALSGVAEAGGGAETTLLVVNAESPDSLRVANEWVHLRGIPASHVLYLQGVPAKPQIDVETFRTAIWTPIRERLASVPWGEEIDLIAYSAGFPYYVDFASDAKAAGIEGNAPISPGAALTAMTYLARRVEKKDASYLGTSVNRYFRRDRTQRAAPSRSPTAEEQAFFRQAVEALQKKDYAAAADAFRRLLETYPDTVEGWYNFACCLALLGKTDEALAALGSAVDKGWSDAAHTEADEDLASLRGKKGFDEVLERMRGRRVEWQPSRAFRSRFAWGADDDPKPEPDAEDLDRYWLSVMLAYTGERGTTADEAVSYLRAAASSDGTNPAGTVYLMVNKDVRSTTREPLFGSTVSALRGMGRKAQVLSPGKDGQDGVLPQSCDDVMGIVAGIAGFNWGPCKSRLLPGSIAEHLTSFGAAFEINGQTKCTEFLKAGAAGTCGTVAEPYALQWKFPVPHIHVHYAMGCSLAEAFYQSVEGPYQLLVLGDPLARPFATFATLTLANPDPKPTWKGTVSIEPQVTPGKDHPIAVVELWVDGTKVGEAAPGSPIPWDTKSSEDGAHDLRLVAVEAGPIQTRSSLRATIHVGNAAHPVKVKAPASVDLGDLVKLSGSAKDGKTLEILLGSRVVASVPVRMNTWKAEIPSTTLGVGTVTLTARSVLATGSAVLSDPIPVEVKPAKP